MKLYIDSCVYVDFLGIPKTKFDTTMSEKASKFFNHVLLKKHKILLSGWAIKETERVLNDQNIAWESLKPFFAIYGSLIETIICTDEDKQKAKLLCPNNYDDALHVILAEKSKANYIITSNLAHFKRIKSTIQVLCPSEFLALLL